MTTPTSSTEAPSGRRLPLFQGLLPFDRARFPTEVLAGTTLAALAIPEVMGYTSIAGMPVITGLYTILLPVLVFAVFGSSRHLVVGADSATAAVMAAGLAGLAATGSSDYVALAGALALLAAILLIVARLIGLGFLADFLSRTVLIGFLTGVGIQVACGQVGGMLGIPSGDGLTIGNYTFGGSISELLSTLEGIDAISWTTVAVSAGVLGTILGLKLLSRKIPGPLIAVVGAIFVSWYWDLADHGVATLGKLPSGLPTLGLPDVPLSELPALFGTAVSIFVLILAQSAATSRAYAAKYNDKFDENVDLLGLATASAAAGVSGTFVVNGSPTKTQMVDDAGGRTQIAQVTTGLIVGFVLLFLTTPIQYMPQAVLSSIVFLIGIELIDVAGMRRVLRRRPDEFVVAALVMVIVVMIGVEQGIVVAIIASVIDQLRLSYRPDTKVMRTTDDGSWEAAPTDADTRTVPGLVVYLFPGNLYYANANLFFEQTSAFAAAAEPPRWLCLDARMIPDIDYSGGETIRQLHGELDEQGIKLVIAGATGEVTELLDRYGLTELLGDDALFATVDDVVTRFEDRSPPDSAGNA